MIKLSVVMPVYNAQDYLEMSLNSIINQNISDIEIICVNDGSTDASSKILKKYSKKYDFIRIFTQPNQGSGNARNKGIGEATGEYIAFLDADDIFLDNDALDKMYQQATRTNAPMIAANLKRIRKNGLIDEEYNPYDVPFKYFMEDTVISSREYGIPWAFYKNIYKKTFIEENSISFPNLSRGQDPIFLAKILSLVDEIPALNVDFYGYNHSVSGGVNVKINSIDKKKDYIQHFIDTLDILSEYDFDETYITYKQEFINYLNFKQNIQDNNIRKILTDIKGLDKHFNNNDFGYLIIDIARNDSLDTDEDYNLIKQCLFEESMLEDTFIDIYRLQEFAKISKHLSNDENLLKSSYKELKNIENYTFEEKRRIFGVVDRYKKNIAHYIKSNNKILTSNSWKLTGFFRSLNKKS